RCLERAHGVVEEEVAPADQRHADVDRRRQQPPGHGEDGDRALPRKQQQQAEEEGWSEVDGAPPPAPYLFHHDAVAICSPRRVASSDSLARAKVGSPSRWNERGRPNGQGISATTRPGRGLITQTRSARNSASSTSCVTNTTERRLSSHTPSSHSCIPARVSASSAPNGSS